MAAYEAASVQPSNPQVALQAAATTLAAFSTSELDMAVVTTAADVYLRWLNEKDALQ